MRSLRLLLGHTSRKHLLVCRSTPPITHLWQTKSFSQSSLANKALVNKSSSYISRIPNKIIIDLSRNEVITSPSFQKIVEGLT